MPTIVDILTFMSGINSCLVELIKVKKLCFFSIAYLQYEQEENYSICLNTMKKFSCIYWKIEVELQNDGN